MIKTITKFPPPQTIIVEVENEDGSKETYAIERKAEQTDGGGYFYSKKDYKKIKQEEKEKIVKRFMEGEE